MSLSSSQAESEWASVLTMTLQITGSVLATSRIWLLTQLLEKAKVSECHKMKKMHSSFCSRVTSKRNVWNKRRANYLLVVGEISSNAAL